MPFQRTETLPAQDSGGRPALSGGNVKLEALVVSHPLRYVRLKFDKSVYCVIELRTGDDAAEVAKKLRELADQVERLKQ